MILNRPINIKHSNCARYSEHQPISLNKFIFKQMFNPIALYRVTHIGSDFRDDCKEFIWSVSYYFPHRQP